jgi:putative ABC transport system permease protein
MKEDVVFALRSLRRQPAFAALVIAVLAIGIGTATAIANVYNTVLLRQLPVPDAERVVAMWGEHRTGQFDRVPLSARGFRVMSEENRSFTTVAATDYNGAYRRLFRHRGEPIELAGLPVSGRFFGVLGARALLGRALEPEDDVSGGPASIVLSYGAWTTQFGGDTAILGRAVRQVSTGADFTIVGVMPSGFEYPRGVQFWGSIGAMAPDGAVHVIGRLRPGVTLDAAQRELTTFFANEPAPMLRGAIGVGRSLPDSIVGDVRPALRVLAVAVGLLLLVACVNVANLFLIRGVERSREMAVRSALGAGRLRLVRQLLTESSIVALAAGVIGAAVAIGLQRALVAAAPAELPRLDDIAASGAALWTGVITIVAAVLFGLAPAFLSAGQRASGALAGGRRWGTEGRTQRRIKDVLVAGQLALAVLILTSAGLVGRSLMRLQQLDMGYATERMLVAQLGWPSEKYGEVPRARALYHRLLESVERTPGVVSAAPLNTGPFAGTGGWDGMFVVEEPREGAENANAFLNMEVASAGFFGTMGIALRDGRVFTDGDRTGSQAVLVVSEGAARALWPGRSAIGRRLKMGTRSTDWWTVVGVVADTRYREFTTLRQTVYFPFEQLPFPFPPTMIAVRTVNDPAEMALALRRIVTAIDPDVVVARTATMTSLLDEPLAQPRLNALLLGVFATVVVVLAAVGLYGVLAWTVRQRTRELGIRIALGAQPGQLHALVVRRGLLIAAAGIAAGVAGALGTSRFLRALLFEISPTDPITIGTASVLLLVVAVVACLTPARRATRVDPMLALRAE